MLRAIRLLFMVLLAVVTLLPFVGPVTDFPGGASDQQQFSIWEFFGLLSAVFAFEIGRASWRERV